MNGNWRSVENHISEVTGKTIHFENSKSVSGGCINDSFNISDLEHNHWFIKTNKPELIDMFEAEAAGLDELKKSETIRIPKKICCGTTAAFSYLVLEHIPLKSQISQQKTGIQLAQMHQTFSSHFGWARNNNIGSTIQSNTPHDDWISFWKEERMLFQLKLAKDKGYPYKAYDSGLELAEKIHLFFTDYQPRPSLLHGDLWGGNCASDNNNNPVIYDPAVYYGDRETDIAMTELFGGFNQDFYAAYNDSCALDPGYKTRKNLYNLYHILNHYNLFGGSYASQANSVTQKLLSEV